MNISTTVAAKIVWLAKNYHATKEKEDGNCGQHNLEVSVVWVWSFEWIRTLQGHQANVSPAIGTKNHVAEKLCQWEPSRVNIHPVVNIFEELRLCIDLE